jgi:hypothetical protein
MQRLSQPAEPCVELYDRALGLLALETSRDLRLLPTFLAILAMVPPTIMELRRDARRLAA